MRTEDELLLASAILFAVSPIFGAPIVWWMLGGVVFCLAKRIKSESRLR